MANAAATMDGQDVFWVVCEIGNEQHVIPIGDLRPHTGFDCWCKPTTENDGIWVHNSVDRREHLDNSET